jgi:ABC-type amino acid transport substrate-binding protein
VTTEPRAWPAVLVGVLVCAMLGAGGCGDDDGGGGGDGRAGLNTISAGELRVGSDIPYPPFEFGRPPDYQGFDIDMVDEIAKRLELEPRFVRSPFDPIFRNVAQGRFDMVATAAIITPERERIAAFSDPYLPADQSLMVRVGSDVENVDDLAGKTVGAQVGATGAGYAKDETDAETVRTYDSVEDAFKALQAGQIDAVIHDFPVAKYEERSKPSLRVVQTIATDENYGFAFAKRSQELRRRVDGELARMKQDGTYARIYRKCFEQDPPERILETGGGSGGG